MLREVLCNPLPKFPRLQCAHIVVCYFWPCDFPLFWYATIATSVLPAVDFTLGKSSPLQEGRLYLAELFGCLRNKCFLPDGLAEHFRIDSMLAILQESQQSSCERTSSEESDPIAYLYYRHVLRHMFFLFHKPYISEKVSWPDVKTCLKKKPQKKQNQLCQLKSFYNLKKK